MTKAKELILGISPQRLQKLKGGGFGGEGAPIRVKLRGAGGEIMGGMLSVAGSQHGGTLSLAGAGTDWMKLAKKAASVAAPLSLVGGAEMAPVAAALGAFSGSGKKNKKKATVRKTKKTVGLAAEIGKILLDTAGKEKEGEALSKVGRVIAGSGKKSKKIKNTIADASQIAALLGQTSGYMTPQQAAAASAVGQLIQGSGELHGDVFQPPVQHLPPKKTTARPKVAVTGEGHTAPKKKRFTAVQ